MSCRSRLQIFCRYTLFSRAGPDTEFNNYMLLHERQEPPVSHDCYTSRNIPEYFICDTVVYHNTRTRAAPRSSSTQTFVAPISLLCLCRFLRLFLARCSPQSLATFFNKLDGRGLYLGLHGVGNLGEGHGYVVGHRADDNVHELHPRGHHKRAVRTLFRRRVWRVLALRAAELP